MITAVCSMFSVHSPNTRRQDVFVLSSLGPKYFREICWLFPFQRILDPLELRSTNVVETFLKNLNGPECCHLTSAGTGKKVKEKASVAALLKYFLCLVIVTKFELVSGAK